jgi:hypothetical protein
MSQNINRLYDSLERANEAAQALKTHRFDRFDEVFVITGRDASGAALSTDQIVAELLKAFVLKSHAKIYAEGIKSGATLVAVHAYFGTAVSATNLLDSFGPIPSGVEEVSDRLPEWDEAAPISSVLHMPTLVSSDNSFSKFWSLPILLKRGATTFSALGLSELTQSKGPFTGTFPLQLLAKSGPFLSSMIGLPLLLGARGSK